MPAERLTHGLPRTAVNARLQATHASARSEFGAEILGYTPGDKSAVHTGTDEFQLKRVDEEEVGRRPERAGDCGLRPAGDYDFEDFVLVRERVQEGPAFCG